MTATTEPRAAPARSATSTASDVVAQHADRAGALRRLKQARRWRRAGLAAMALLLVVGLLGFLGVRYGEVTATNGTTTLRVRYPRIGRPGLAVSWQVEVERVGGFDGDVELSVDARYFDHLDENGIDPEPAETRSAGDGVVWIFTEPEGDRLVVDLDARISPTWQPRSEGSVAVVEAGTPTLTVSFTSWNLP